MQILNIPTSLKYPNWISRNFKIHGKYNTIVSNTIQHKFDSDQQCCNSQSCK